MKGKQQQRKGSNKFTSEGRNCIQQLAIKEELSKGPWLFMLLYNFSNVAPDVDEEEDGWLVMVSKGAVAEVDYCEWRVCAICRASVNHYWSTAIHSSTTDRGCCCYKKKKWKGCVSIGMSGCLRLGINEILRLLQKSDRCLMVKPICKSMDEIDEQMNGQTKTFLLVIATTTRRRKREERTSSSSSITEISLHLLNLYAGPWRTDQINQTIKFPEFGPTTSRADADEL